MPVRRKRGRPNDVLRDTRAARFWSTFWSPVSTEASEFDFVVGGLDNRGNPATPCVTVRPREGQTPVAGRVDGANAYQLDRALER